MSAATAAALAVPTARVPTATARVPTAICRCISLVFVYLLVSLFLSLVIL